MARHSSVGVNVGIDVGKSQLDAVIHEGFYPFFTDSLNTAEKF